MKTISFKFLLAILLMPALTIAGGLDGKYTEKKTIRKDFNVSANDLLGIDNSYGNIDIITWDKNRVEIEVIIITNGNDQEQVKQRLNEISVNFEKSETSVRAETLFKDRESSWWSNLFGNSNNINIEVNYRIKAPVTNNMELSNDYGNINLDELEGNAQINCDYGKLMIGQLKGSNNSLNFDYTRSSSIGYLNKGTINADYSEFTVEEAGTVELSADYTDAELEKVERIQFNNDYGSLKMGKIKTVRGQGDYLGIEMGALYGSAVLELDYGTLKLEQIMPSLEKLVINSDYTTLKIGYDNEASFDFDINTSYGSVKGLETEGFTLKKHQESGSDHYYQGFYKTDRTGGKIRIESEYGNVIFRSR